jgi:hypothetical protein
MNRVTSLRSDADSLSAGIREPEGESLAGLGKRRSSSKVCPPSNWMQTCAWITNAPAAPASPRSSDSSAYSISSSGSRTSWTRAAGYRDSA